MGIHGLGQMSENRECFVDLCTLNQLVIGGSIFSHKRIHKVTWKSQDQVTMNEIDHICVSQSFGRLWRDVRAMRGADVSSDHHLLVTAVRLQLERYNNTQKRFNEAMLRDKDTQSAFKISLSLTCSS
jgi:hypothetical protein